MVVEGTRNEREILMIKDEGESRSEKNWNKKENKIKNEERQEKLKK